MSAGKNQILLIEDDPVMGGSLQQRLRLEGFEVQWTRTASDGLAMLRRAKFDAVISDIRLPDRSGEQLYKDAMSLLGRTPIMFVTAFPDLQQAVRLVQAGADDYMQKPFSTDRLVERLQQLIGRACSKGRDVSGDDPFDLSEAMAAVAVTLRRIADLDTPVLISGETGVGKEIAARFLYEVSKRRGAPFTAVNCAALNEQFMECAMFGQEHAGAPGTSSPHIGYFEECADGVLFLDEVADLNPRLQASMLRAVQERRFRRVGGVSDIAFRGRIVSATNSDIRERIAVGRFREDLYYRLAVISISVPPLRDRLGEIRRLADSFLRDVRERFDSRALDFSDDAWQAMVRHDWPGNVRELKNRIERAAAVSEAGMITELNLFPDKGLKVSRPSSEKPLAEARAVAERKEIEIALAQTDGRIGEAAKALGISRTTLWKRMKALELSDHDLEFKG